MSSVRGVALRPRGQVIPLGVLLLVFRVATTTMVRRPAGVALLRVAHPSSAGIHQAPGADRVTASVASNAAVHGKMIEARPRPRSSPRGVHGWRRGGGGWRMDVMMESWGYGRPETGRSLSLQTARLSSQLPLMTTGQCACFLGHLKLLF